MNSNHYTDQKDRDNTTMPYSPKDHNKHQSETVRKGNQPSHDGNHKPPQSGSGATNAGKKDKP